MMAFPGIILAIALSVARPSLATSSWRSASCTSRGRAHRAGSVLVIRERRTSRPRGRSDGDGRIIFLQSCELPVAGDRAGHVHLRRRRARRGRAVVPGRRGPAADPLGGATCSPGTLYLQQRRGSRSFPAPRSCAILGLNLFGDGLRDLLDRTARRVGGAAKADAKILFVARPPRRSRGTDAERTGGEALVQQLRREGARVFGCRACSSTARWRRFRDDRDPVHTRPAMRARATWRTLRARQREFVTALVGPAPAAERDGRVSAPRIRRRHRAVISGQVPRAQLGRASGCSTRSTIQLDMISPSQVAAAGASTPDIPCRS